MPRFFINKEKISEASLFIDGDDARHIARSLRMAVGDEVTVCDGEGNEFLCSLTRIRDERCDLDIKESRRCEAEPLSKISLYMAYPKGDKLELVVQKAVELGVSEIIPFESSRCIKKPKAEKAQEKNARLCRIAEEAAKQCGRGILPKVALPLSFGEAMKRASEATLTLFCYEGNGTKSLKSILSEQDTVPESIAVIVGSEGGFSLDEAEEAKSLGAALIASPPFLIISS